MTPTERIVALEADVAKLQWQVARLITAKEKQVPEATAGRTIPLHVADQAVAACEAELAKVKAEADQLKAEVELWKERYNGTSEAKMHRLIYGIPKEGKQ